MDYDVSVYRCNNIINGVIIKPMKRLTIENWDTSRKITQWEYTNGLVIGEVTDKSTMYGGAYIYGFYKRGEHIVSIKISRAEAGGKFAIKVQLLYHIHI